jgi:hypothetical protein
MVDYDRRHRQHRNDIDALYERLARIERHETSPRVTGMTRRGSHRSRGSVECRNCEHVVTSLEIRQQVLSGSSPTCVNPVCCFPLAV